MQIGFSFVQTSASYRIVIENKLKKHCLLITMSIKPTKNLIIKSWIHTHHIASFWLRVTVGPRRDATLDSLSQSSSRPRPMFRNISSFCLVTLSFITAMYILNLNHNFLMTKSHDDSPNFLFYTIYSIGAIGFSMCNQNRFDDQKDSDFFY